MTMFVYNILRADEWSDFEAAGATKGAPYTSISLGILALLGGSVS